MNREARALEHSTSAGPITPVATTPLQSPRAVYVGLVLIVTVMGAAASLTLLGVGFPTGQITCLVAGFLFLGICLAYLVGVREELVSPISLFLLVMMVWFGLRAVVVGLASDSLVHRGAFSVDAKWDALLFALVLSGVWAVSATATYHSRIARWFEHQVRERRFLQRPMSDQGIWKAVCLYSAGLAGKAYRLIEGSYLGVLEARAQAGGLLIQTAYDPIDILAGTLLPMVGQIGLIFTSLLAARDKRWVLLTAVVIIEFSWAYLSATRGAFIAVGATVLLALYLTGRLSRRSLIIGAPLGVIAAFAIVAPYRHLVYELGLVDLERLTLPLLAEHVLAAFTSGWAGVVDEPLDFFKGDVLSRFAGLDRFGGAITAIWEGRAGIVGGETFVNGIVGSMPRVIWPERPTLNIGYWFPVHYLGASSATQTVIPIPRVVEFYVNFGLIGVVAGGAIMGTLLRGVRGFLSRSLIVALAFYLFFVVTFVLIGEKPFSGLFQLWKPTVVLVASSWWLTSPSDDHRVRITARHARNKSHVTRR